MGFPDEDLDSINKTIDLPSELGLDFAAFFVAQPYLGTRLRAIFEQEGLLSTGEIKASSIMFSSYHTKRFTSEELAKFQQLAYKKFIKRRMIQALIPFNIGRIIYKINTPEKFLYFLKIASNLLLGIRPGRIAPRTISEMIVNKR